MQERTVGRASRLATLMAMDGDGAEDEDDKDPSAREGQQSTRAQEIGSAVIDARKRFWGSSHKM